MGQEYTSFVLRCWHLDGDEQRIKIEHIQSGERTQVTTLAAAIGWISARWCGQVGDQVVTSGQAQLRAQDDGGTST